MNIYQIIFISVLVLTAIGAVVLYFAVMRKSGPYNRNEQHELRRLSSLSNNTDIDIMTAFEEVILSNADILDVG